MSVPDAAAPSSSTVSFLKTSGCLHKALNCDLLNEFMSYNTRDKTVAAVVSDSRDLLLSVLTCNRGYASICLDKNQARITWVLTERYNG